ncbi:MAG: peptidoglycan-binding protein [Armatimonadota bacterium]|nr:peptidoglycan-binding protein [Armatimonadota bacterium]
MPIPRRMLPALAGLCLLALPGVTQAAPATVQLRAVHTALAWPAVRRGDEDASNYRVSMIQFLLRAHGVSVPVDGRFGPQTQRAVIRFQRARGLLQTGVVANRTWARLIVRLHSGSSGDAVRAAQKVLRDVAAPRVSVDGRFGARTARAVRAFQREQRLTADGVVGPETWLALMENFLD